ncbi:GAF domain-containing sensor histidine kinase [Caldimonas sp. KR1-144]|uniref:GAF domain-containing sensor histidine kinase n=1 Tax=Caldimonas sp. KR1-144 TaxID=3400911 RepID=UPI003C0F0818
MADASPASPGSEPSRLDCLRGYDILDTAPERSFDDIVLLAARICQAPIALVSFVDEQRQWFKARIGLDSEQTPRDIAFCNHAIRQPDALLTVPDARLDARFAGNPMVTSAPHIRFYAGTALVTPDGHALGTLCVKDVVPRQLDAAQCDALEALGRQVVTLLELRRSVRERRLLDERHRLVLESVANAIVMVDEADRIVLANAQAQSIFGHAPSDLIGQPIDLLIPPRQRLQRRLERQALRAGSAAQPQAAETLGLHQDGSTIATETGLTRLVSDRQTYLIESVLDVSHRKSIEARLNAMQTLHQAIVDNAGCAIIAASPEGLVTSFNPAAQRMFGYSAEEVVGLRRPEVVDGVLELAAATLASRPPAFEMPAAGDREGGPSGCECACVRKDGSRIPVLLSVTALRDGFGAQTGFLGLAIDISDRKRTEDLLRAKNEDLRTFAYTVSHDLKAPLRGIVGYAQELMRRHQDGLGERARFCLAQIITATNNLDQLIEDLLDYSRLIAEKPLCGKVRLPELVDRILSDRSHALAEQGVELDVHVPGLVVRTWERGLHQALSNLIDNALKYSRQAQPPRLRIRAEAADNGCRISVADNGIGFDMKYHDRIFGLFNRLVRASDYEGTGAGLAIVAKAVDKLGGRVHAESVPGQGAAFFIEVPHLPAEVCAS